MAAHLRRDGFPQQGDRLAAVSILVIGASGQVGRQLMKQLHGREVLGTGFRNAGGLERLDLADTAAVEAIIRDYRPDGICAPGGVTAVDWCEDHVDEARRICVDGSAAIQRAANAIGAFVVHFGTDYVFPGGDGPYAEDATPRPLSAYGRIKLEAEQAIRAEGGRWALVRTSMVYSHDPGGRNFAQFVRDRLTAGQEVSAFTDQSGSPTYAPALAAAAIEILDRQLDGVWHVAGPEVMTRFEFASRLARAFRLPTATLKPVTTPKMPLPAARPGLRGGLDVARAREALAAPLTGLDDACREMTRL